jgi:hypothetical protein
MQYYSISISELEFSELRERVLKYYDKEKEGRVTERTVIKTLNVYKTEVTHMHIYISIIPRSSIVFYVTAHTFLFTIVSFLNFEK